MYNKKTHRFSTWSVIIIAQDFPFSHPIDIAAIAEKTSLPVNQKWSVIVAQITFSEYLTSDGTTPSARILLIALEDVIYMS